MHWFEKFKYFAAGMFFCGGLLAGVLLFTFIQAGAIYDYQDSLDGAMLPEVDAIVCLAGGKGRIAAAGDFWYRYFDAEENKNIEKTPILYISGMGPQSNWSTFQTQVRPGVLKAMKPQDVVLETESENTEANAAFLVKNARLRGWKRIVLITSPYHMRRAKFIFGRVLAKSGATMQVDTLSIFQEPFNADEWRGSVHGIQVTMFEYLKWLYYTSVWQPTKVAM